MEQLPMTGLDIFALIVLAVMVGSGLGIWAMLGMFPGKIARERNHPQAEAISICGWCGAITMGILSPIAFIWAYTNPALTLDRELPSVRTDVKGEASPTQVPES
jgi:hypothetical protein